MSSSQTSVSKQVQSALTKRDVANMMPKALEVMEEALTSSNEALKVSAAKYIIDQSVGKASQEIMNNSNGAGALAEAAATAINKLIESHPGLGQGIETIPTLIENPATGVFEIGDPDQE